MKTLLCSTIVLYSLILFTGCKKDTETPTPSPIVGNWTVSTFRVESYLNNNKVSDSTENSGDKVIFRSDGTYNTTDPAGGDSEDGTYQYSASNKTLSLLKDGDTLARIFTVAELTATKLVLTSTAVYNPPQNGVDKQVYTFVLIK